MNKIEKHMRDRLAKGLDPLTGDPLVIKGSVRWAFGPEGEDLHKMVDDTGREVDLDAKGNYFYVDNMVLTSDMRSGRPTWFDDAYAEIQRKLSSGVFSIGQFQAAKSEVDRLADVMNGYRV